MMFDEPVPLNKAATIFFPYGGIKKATLMQAIRDGNLPFERLGKSYFVTRAGIEAWRKACRDKQRGRAAPYTSERGESPSFDRNKVAAASALAKAKLLIGARKK